MFSWIGKSRPAFIGVAIAMALATVGAYARLRGNDFVNLDDNFYITGNCMLQKGLSRETLVWALTNTFPYWHPLTWLSLLMDHELFGLNPAGYHLVSLLFHTLSALLLFAVLSRMTRRVGESAFVAALFALHPLNVESVAWAVERKDVLSTFFWMLTLWTYVGFAERPSLGRYLLVCLGFALGLMAKLMIVTLPCVLLLLDYWPLGRLPVTGEGSARGKWLAVGRLFIEKLPLLLLSAASMAITTLASPGNRGVAEWVGIPLGERISHSLVAYVRYVGKIIWPAKLSVYYPYHEYSLVQVGGAALLLVAVTAVAVAAARRCPWFIVGWLWFLGVMLPVVGVVRTGEWPDIANRFAYLPAIGLYLIVAWGGMELMRGRPYGTKLLGAAAAAIVAVLGILTFQQVGYWRNTITLFEHALEVSGESALAYCALGGAYLTAGDHEKGLALLAKESELKPDGFSYDLAMAQLHFDRQEFAEAAASATKALLKKDGEMGPQFLMGEIHEARGEYEQAVQSYTRVMASTLLDTDSFRCRAAEKRQQLLAKFASELDAMRREVARNPQAAGARLELATRLHSLGLYEEALQHYLSLEKGGMDSSLLYSGLAQVLTFLKRPREAAVYYEKELELNPADTAALN
ncbi:MAG TPA: tetratricopeptide repeat protein, partial [Geobacteraceae bacterium]